MKLCRGGKLCVNQGYDHGYLTAGNDYEIEFFYGGISHAIYDVRLMVYPDTMSMSETSIKF